MANKQSYTFGPLLLLAIVAAGANLGCSSPMVREDLRSPGEYMDDVVLARLVRAEVFESLGQLKDERVRVTVHRRIVLLTGQLASEERKRIAGQAAAQVQHLRAVQNEISTENVRTVVGRTSDSVIAATARRKISNLTDVVANQLDLVVDKGNVYLIGVVTRHEGNAAAEAVRYIRGVTRVVKVFDYLD